MSNVKDASPGSPTVGVVAEYNPFHNGHALHVRRTLETMGSDRVPVVAVMSGNFTQRADAAIMAKHIRAEAAVAGGVDLVIELPLPYATGSAEYFARGAVRLLAATGVVTHISFGSECGDITSLKHCAEALDSESVRIRTALIYKSGLSYPAARQRAAEEAGLDGELLSHPNNTLGIEYLRAVNMLGCGLTAISPKREGAGHDSAYTSEGIASASHIRELLVKDKLKEVGEYMFEYTLELYRNEWSNYRAPVKLENNQRGIITHLRRLSPADYMKACDAEKGLAYRVYKAVREHTDIEAVHAEAKTKRYAHSRVRRMVLDLFLGIGAEDRKAAPEYIRPLCFNETGRRLLKRIKTEGGLPLVMKPSGPYPAPEIARMLEKEAAATDLYMSLMPKFTVQAGIEYKMSPIYKR